MGVILLSLLLLLLPLPATAAPCDAPGYTLLIDGGVTFQHGMGDTKVVGFALPSEPEQVHAFVVDERHAVSAWTDAQVLWVEQHGAGVIVKVAVKNQRVLTPGYTEVLRAVLCVKG